jgi:hypothetical protein
MSEQFASTEANPDRRAHITLVHGTWGRGFIPDKRLFWWSRREPIWSETNSEFCRELKRELINRGITPQLEPYVWSGSNSVLTREEEACRLAKKLERQAVMDQNSCVPRVVIGHSHGGNIALNAARKSRAQCYVVTLATPFLDLIPFSTAKSWLPYSFSAFPMKNFKIRVLSFVLTCYIYIIALDIMGVPVRRILESDQGSWYLIPGIFCFVVLGVIFNNVAYKYEDALAQIASSYRPLHEISVPTALLVLRGADDEAALMLAAGSIDSLLTSPMIRLVSLLIAVMVSFPVLIVVAIFGHFQYFVHVLNGTLLLFLSLAGLAALGRSVFGKELAVGGATLWLNINSSPDTGGNVCIQTLSGQIGTHVRKYYGPDGKEVIAEGYEQYRYGRRHALYYHSECASAIADWLDHRLERP